MDIAEGLAAFPYLLDLPRDPVHDDYGHALELALRVLGREGDRPRGPRLHTARKKADADAVGLEVDLPARDLDRLVLRDVGVPRGTAPRSDEGEEQDGKEERDPA